MKIINKHITSFFQNYSFFICFSVLILYFLLYILQGQNAVITIHDNLDSAVVWRKLLKEAGVLFNIDNQAIVPQVMNGLKRNSFNVGSISIISFLYYFFPAYWAYIINFCLFKLIGFFGLYFLLKNYILSNHSHSKAISGILALSFSFLASYTIYGLGASGLPFLLYSILNILNKKYRFSSYLYIAFYPFYSSIIYTGYAVILLIILVILYFIIIKNPRFIRLLIILCVILISSIISELNIFNQFLFDKIYVSHRLTWGFEYSYGLKSVFIKALLLFINGYYHQPSTNLLIIVFLIIVGIYQYKILLNNKYIMILIFILVFISLFYGIYYFNSFIYLKQKFILLKIFQFNRFYFIAPFLWYMLFALLINEFLSLRNKKTNLIIYSFLILNLSYVLLSNQEVKENIYNMLIKKKYITYKQFYSENLYNKIKQKINLQQEKYRVVSLGIFPSIAQYNGFYTLDSYQPSYDLEYKLKFRKVIEGELEKSDDLKKYFDNWGCRCYIFSFELDKNFYVTTKKFVKYLKINTEELKEMGCKYIISAVEINNAKDINLIFIDKFTDINSPLTVYLYKV